jgi:hypothetical protein
VGKGGDLCGASCLEGFAHTLVFNVNSAQLLDALGFTAALTGLNVELPICLPYSRGVAAAEALTTALKNTSIPIIRTISAEYIGCTSYEPKQAGVIGIAFNVVTFTEATPESTTSAASSRLESSVGSVTRFCRGETCNKLMTIIGGGINQAARGIVIQAGAVPQVQAAFFEGAENPSEVASEEPLLAQTMEAKVDDVAVATTEGQEGGRRLMQQHGASEQLQQNIGRFLQSSASIQLRKGETRCFLDTTNSDIYPAVAVDPIQINVDDSFFDFGSLTSTSQVSGYARNLPLPANVNDEFVITDVPPAGSPSSIGKGALKFFVSQDPAKEAQVRVWGGLGAHLEIWTPELKEILL